MDRGGDEQAGQPMGCGTRRTAFITICCACRTAGSTRLKVRSMVGLLPLCATTVIEPAQRKLGHSAGFIGRRCKQMPYILESIHPTGPGHIGVGDRGILALLNPQRLRRILSKMLDENEFLSPYGIRSLSRYHEGPSVCD